MAIKSEIDELIEILGDRDVDITREAAADAIDYYGDVMSAATELLQGGG
jgi:hypothetical protein